MGIRQYLLATLSSVATAAERALAPTDEMPVVDLRNGPAPTVEDLTREMGAPRMGTVRNELSVGASRNMTPQRLANLLRAAEQDDADAYLSLAEEMEEKDLHYLAVLGQRKRQVAQLPMTLGAASKDAADEEIAKDVQENIVDANILDGIAFDLLDAVGKGFALAELIWQIDGNKWKIDRLEWVNPRFTKFDRDTQREPMLLDDNGQPCALPQYKFAYLEIKAKSGLPIRGGLARAVAWAYMFKNFAIKDWVQFCEIYGIPWRVGSYDQSATQEDKDALLRACCSLSSDAAAIKPKAMDIEIKESGGKTTSGELYLGLASYLDDQVSKAVLGQTRTVDATAGSLGGGDEGTAVREDIERADAKALELCFNKFVIRPYVDLNYGPQKRYPYLTIGRPEAKNAQLMVDAAQKLGGGMKIRVADIREAVGFATPQDNDELYVPPAAAQPFGFPAAPPSPANYQQMQQAIAASRVRAELLAQELEGGADAIAIAARQQAIASDELLKPLRDQILHLAAMSQTAEEFRRRLQALKPDLDMTPLGDRLALLTFQTLAGGIVGDTLRS